MRQNARLTSTSVKGSIVAAAKGNRDAAQRAESMGRALTEHHR